MLQFKFVKLEPHFYYPFRESPAHRVKCLAAPRSLTHVLSHLLSDFRLPRARTMRRDLRSSEHDFNCAQRPVKTLQHGNSNSLPATASTGWLTTSCMRVSACHGKFPDSSVLGGARFHLGQVPSWHSILGDTCADATSATTSLRSCVRYKTAAVHLRCQSLSIKGDHVAVSRFNTLLTSSPTRGRRLWEFPH